MYTYIYTQHTCTYIYIYYYCYYYYLYFVLYTVVSTSANLPMASGPHFSLSHRPRAVLRRPRAAGAIRRARRATCRVARMQRRLEGKLGSGGCESGIQK